MVPDETEITEARFSEILSVCDPAIARIGEAFLDPEFREYFDPEFLRLLQDARKAWV
jgi:hypothetical protein